MPCLSLYHYLYMKVLIFFSVFLPCAFFCHFSWRTWCTIERVTTTRSCCVISTCPGLRMAHSPSPAGHPSTWVLIYHMIPFMFSFSFYLYVLVCKVLTFTSYFCNISCQPLKWWLVIAMEDQSIVGQWGSLCTSCKWHCDIKLICQRFLLSLCLAL